MKIGDLVRSRHGVVGVIIEISGYDGSIYEFITIQSGVDTSEWLAGELEVINESR